MPTYVNLQHQDWAIRTARQREDKADMSTVLTLLIGATNKKASSLPEQQENNLDKPIKMDGESIKKILSPEI